ncbi:hypothetical protein HZH66_003423 [Vespula vulgaris]|uniref:Uncharacterized protein n=1 Tax=Vespula vulgaris TaxID=7454 RepID=A0A834KEN2_VESVU|nr:hypothetical protein HZH66_003423 [Vespula vulgaris]
MTKITPCQSCRDNSRPITKGCGVISFSVSARKEVTNPSGGICIFGAMPIEWRSFYVTLMVLESYTISSAPNKIAWIKTKLRICSSKLWIYLKRFLLPINEIRTESARAKPSFHDDNKPHLEGNFAIYRVQEEIHRSLTQRRTKMVKKQISMKAETRIKDYLETNKTLSYNTV